jgi:rhodanese-related sulfurtransferase
VTAPAGHMIANITVDETWAQLQANDKAVLIDVRTAAEWSFVGTPDLSQANKKLVQVEWQNYPDGELNARFVDMVQGALTRLGAGQDSELFLICRSGARSMMAAQALAAAGYPHCHNVADGFEGHLDPRRRRGQTTGWKARGLPWIQG